MRLLSCFLIFFSLQTFSEVILSYARSGDFDSLKALVEQGIHPDIRNEDGSTSLHLAAAHGHSRIVALLLRSGSDPNLQDDEGFSALHYAVLNNNIKIIRYLVSWGGADVNIRDSLERTPLHLAVLHGQIRTIEFLVDQEGIEMNAVDEEGTTAFYMVDDSKYPGLKKYLLDKGADPEISPKGMAGFFDYIIQKIWF